ncbi:MAG: MBL fold metallo-hydrolase, partial [Gammaproteobacteria bacterium]|nr:MBL fold metallo-hydrolase [Gammaproteobacteria bacterium]
TIGGLSAHADQADLMDWYGAFDHKPPVYLVHGESKAQKVLAAKMRKELDAPVMIAEHAQTIQI